jgi:hypothetical protein
MFLLKSSENADLGAPPAELLAGIMQIGEEGTKAGVLLDTGGFAPTAAATSVQLVGTELSVVDGPFTDSPQQVGAYSLWELPSQEEAVKWATRFMQLHLDTWKGWEGKAEIRRLFGPEDFGPPQ